MQNFFTNITHDSGLKFGKNEYLKDNDFSMRQKNIKLCLKDYISEVIIYSGCTFQNNRND